MAPPRTIVERLMEIQAPSAKAEKLQAEFGDQRCAEALDARQYWSKPIRSDLGFVIDYLVNQRPAPPGLVAAWAAQAQQRLPMVGMVPGGGGPPPAAVAAHAVPEVLEEIAGDEDDEELLAFRREWASHVDDVIDAA